MSARGVSSRFIAGDMGLLCYSGSLPGASVANIQSSNFTGVTENIAHTQVFTPLTLEFYCDNEYRSLKFLRHWQEYITSGNGTSTNTYGQPNYNYRVKYPNDPADGYKANSTKIYKFENDIRSIVEYSFIGLFPSNLSSTPVRYGTNSELTRISCSFSYDRMVMGSIYSYDAARGISNSLQGVVDTIDNLTGAVGSVQNLLSRFVN